jgi:branched-chain amino acid transport system substrate-binding protein
MNGSRVTGLLAFAFVVAARSSAACAAEQVVTLGLASNFSVVSTSTSNPFDNFFRDAVTLALADDRERLERAGLRVVTKEFDYQNDPVKALRAAKDAVASDAIGVNGYNWSSHALIAAPIHTAGKLPMITPSATADRLGHIGPFVHMACFDNSFMGREMALVARERLKAKSAVIVTAEDCAYCTDLARAFKAEFERRGGQVAKQLPILETNTEFSALAAKVKASGADVVVVPNQELLSARVIAAIVQTGMNKPFLGGDGWGNVGEQFFGILGGRVFDGYSMSHWHKDIREKRSQSFVASYLARFRKAPNDTAVLAYDATRLFDEALIRAKASGQSPTRASLEAALTGLRSFTGASGQFEFVENQAAPHKSIVLLKAGSKFQVVDVIPPREGGKDP